VKPLPSLTYSADRGGMLLSDLLYIVGVVIDAENVAEVDRLFSKNGATNRFLTTWRRSTAEFPFAVFGCYPTLRDYPMLGDMVRTWREAMEVFAFIHGKAMEAKPDSTMRWLPLLTEPRLALFDELLALRYSEGTA
jgi:hypothetical protein